MNFAIKGQQYETNSFLLNQEGRTTEDFPIKRRQEINTKAVTRIENCRLADERR